MIPDPLHPAIVHFPVVLALLLPLAAIAALVAIRRGAAPRAAWAVPLALAAALALSAWVAVRTGEAQEERVEAVVAERPLHEHEEAGERFLALATVLLVVAAAGLASGVIGTAARVVATLGAAGMVAAAFQVGRSGGELVYRHGAAGAYTADGAQAPRAAPERDDD